IDVNETFTRITGFTRQEALGENPRILNSGRHDAEFYAGFWRSLIEKGHWYGEIWNRRKNGAIFAEMQTIPTFDNLPALVSAAVGQLGVGAERTAGECQIPLHLWNASSFQSWYRAQTGAGMELHGAQVRWVFRIGAKRSLYWALKVDMYIPSENRHKTNEVVISRPDICLTVAWHRPPGASEDETQFALIREYRSPSTSSDGFAWENPGGSTFKNDRAPFEVAADELKEELSIEVDPARVRFHGARQIAATLSAHRAHVYSAELTADEMASLRDLEQQGTHFGVDAESERTYPRVRSFKQLCNGNSVDWATIGICAAVMRNSRLQLTSC
ncbi:MAG: PAS domain S-box protein, partial [Cyanobacteria bacterium]|nr:PAS domain S-box protein [Cyanobacteriota bacterium]